MLANTKRPRARHFAARSLTRGVPSLPADSRAAAVFNYTAIYTNLTDATVLMY